MNLIEDCDTQLEAVAHYFDELAQWSDRLLPTKNTAILETST